VRLVLDNGGGGHDGRELHHGLGHLVQLDAVPLQLHLAVQTTQDLKVAVRQQAAQISGSVHTPTAASKWVVQKSFLRFDRQVDVSRRHTDAAQEYFPNASCWNGAEIAVQDITVHIWNGSPDSNSVI
jgi:hypothetical protein